MKTKIRLKIAERRVEASAAERSTVSKGVRKPSFRNLQNVPLTRQDHAIIKLIAEEGLGHKDLAFRLGQKSANWDITRISRKLGFSNSRPQLRIAIWYWKKKMEEVERKLCIEQSRC